MSTDYRQIDISVGVKDIETAEAIAHTAVPYGIYVEDYSDLESMVQEIAHVDLIDEALLKKDRAGAVIHLYIPVDQNPQEAVSHLQALYTAAGIEHRVETSTIKEDDWAHSWKKYFHPLPVGERLVICPSWEAYDVEEGQVALTLDPGMAFGTGTHHTTKLCLEEMQPLVRPGQRVLDIGCGSGILAVAALLLGAESALLCDIDSTAVKVAAENAERNGVAQRCQFVAGDLTQDVSGQFDLVFANIVADVILRLLPDVGAYMAPGAHLILSGIIDSRAEEVLAACAERGFLVKKHAEAGGWSAVVVTRADAK